MRIFSEITRHVCLCSAEMPREMCEKLSDKFHVIPLPPDDSLAEPVCCHPDMICAVIDKSIIFPTEYAEKNSAVIDEIVRLSGLTVILTDSPRGKKYSSDVGLNAAVGQDFVVCRPESTASELIKIAEKSGRRIINVKQGYAGCSCIVAGDAVLTSDRGIYSALTREGIDVNFCDNHGIILPGYDVGFIGGCGGFFDRMLYFFGGFDPLPCGKVIRNFAVQHGFEICKLSDTTLTDYGGVKILPILL